MAEDNFFDTYTMGEDTAQEVSRSRKGSGFLDGLKSWQRFILSTFLFLDVLILGLLFLIMLGRISFG